MACAGAIGRGALLPGEHLPSVRAMAERLRPMTVGGAIDDVAAPHPEVADILATMGNELVTAELESIRRGAPN